MYKDVLAKLTALQELNDEEISELVTAINNDEVSDVQIAGFQVALLMKGASLNELAAFAKAMRKNCVRNSIKIITPNWYCSQTLKSLYFRIAIPRRRSHDA